MGTTSRADSITLMRYGLARRKTFDPTHTNRPHPGGFSLIELLLIIAILAILTSIAIPLYLGFINQAKDRAIRQNFEAALAYIQGEVSKYATGATATIPTTADIVAALNNGGKVSVYNQTSPAFTTGGNVPGTIQITFNSANQVFSIYAIDNSGNIDLDFDTSITIE